MKNSNYLKKEVLFLTMMTFLLCMFLLIINFIYYYEYRSNSNEVLASIITKIEKEYPDVLEEDIVEIINSKEIVKNEGLRKYGIYLENDSVIFKNKEIIKKIILFDMIGVCCYFGILLIVIVKVNNNKKKDIKEIMKYLQEINNSNYKLEIDFNNDGDFSILKNELYKTAVMLNEKSRISLNDKLALKESLSDISHQIKTPLTSVNLMLDNLINNKELSDNKRKKLLLDVRRKIEDINFLIITLLNLSKFDSNTIVLKEKMVESDKLIKQVIENVEVLCDLKNIKIDLLGIKKNKIYLDYKWNCEALTNVLKNCIEHSKENSKIIIKYIDNDLFSKIEIQDFGDGITQKDMKHIFERYYFAKGSSDNSVGIGLALAKVIIEKSNGNIRVSSQLGKGTTFIITYLKNRS